ncbi:phospholipid-transporting ATPase ABCA3 [Rhipicephalus sanguineus]|uniref:phospholipid-transporting ATPase ABCA3 n=1 Tax=Rhipicephalus sanguineus TaxID=34632 RepID=UPI0018957A4D|nr:phospholipid-transporting ATPase ABCA3 [Rhipicephalus sanguineus]
MTVVVNLTEPGAPPFSGDGGVGTPARVIGYDIRQPTRSHKDLWMGSAGGGGVFYDLCFMLIYGILIFLYLLYRISESRSRRNAFPDGKPAIPKDEDVVAEWEAVEQMCNRSDGNLAKNTLVARRLHKSYGELQVVKELSLALRPAECFGLLGVNGAGKTTTFRMLTALTPMTYGEAYMGSCQLAMAPSWQSRIGYCPQRDALLGKLNAYENLYLFGRLRGVPEESLPDVVAQLIDVTDLKEHAAKRCDYYRYGSA